MTLRTRTLKDISTLNRQPFLDERTCRKRREPSMQSRFGTRSQPNGNLHSTPQRDPHQHQRASNHGSRKRECQTFGSSLGDARDVRTSGLRFVSFCVHQSPPEKASKNNNLDIATFLYRSSIQCVYLVRRFGSQSLGIREFCLTFSTPDGPKCSNGPARGTGRSHASLDDGWRWLHQPKRVRRLKRPGAREAGCSCHIQRSHRSLPLRFAMARNRAVGTRRKSTAGASASNRRPRMPNPAGSKRRAPAAWKLILAGRLRAVFGTMTNREIADTTGHNRETVRRFLASGSPNVSFLVDTSRACGVSVDWLLGLRSAKH